MDLVTYTWCSWSGPDKALSVRLMVLAGLRERICRGAKGSIFRFDSRRLKSCVLVAFFVSEVLFLVFFLLLWGGLL